MVKAISCEGVQKKFGDFEAVRSLSLDVPAGLCFGLLGPNGAGKSTLIRMLYGASSVTSGKINVLGLNPHTDGRELRSRIGVVTQENYLDMSMTAAENMNVYSGFMGLEENTKQQRIADLMDEMALSHKKDEPIERLSGGMQRRLVFVRALLSQPELIILDEPTTGLDPAVRQVLWDKIVELKQKGVTVLLTTHYMDEAERLCDELVIMDHGQVRAQGSPNSLIEEHCAKYVASVSMDAIKAQQVDEMKAKGFVCTEKKGEFWIQSHGLHDLTLFFEANNIEH